MHEEEMKKILVYLKGFSNNERNVLAPQPFYQYSSM
jgi:hypothetical protein